MINTNISDIFLVFSGDGGLEIHRDGSWSTLSLAVHRRMFIGDGRDYSPSAIALRHERANRREIDGNRQNVTGNPEDNFPWEFFFL